MVIKDKCKDLNWKMIFTATGAMDTLSKKEIADLRPILHLAGDAVILASNVQDDKTRRKVIATFNSIIEVTRHQLDGGLTFILEQQIKNAELVGKFSYEEVFGENIRNALYKLCKSPQDKLAYKEAFPDEDDWAVDLTDFPMDEEDEDEENEHD